MESQSGWRAKIALVCYFALLGGILIGSIILALLLFAMGIDHLDSPFPVTLIGIPINETIIFIVTLLFAKNEGASLKELGLKKPSLRILAAASVLAVFLFLLGFGVAISQEIVFGPDPTAEYVARLVTPTNSFQLIVMIVLSLVLVGPCEELAFRGFVQKGFENSFGKTMGLLVASVLFGLLHGLNTLYAIVPAVAAGLVLGYVWQKTGGNTAASASMHGINNSISLAIAYFLAA